MTAAIGFSGYLKPRGSFWQDRYNATAIATGEHLLRCLVYIDLNMVRAGVVDHPSKWHHGEHNEIQAPRRKNIIIAYERLRELAGFEDYESFVSAQCMWIQAALEEIDAKWENRWTERIAGGRPFIEPVKKAMGAMAKGRCLQPGEGAFELREDRK